MKNTGKAQSLNVFFLLVALALTVFCLSACKTTSGDDDEGSDLPWNTPQPWEGAPTIPGMSGMGG